MVYTAFIRCYIEQVFATTFTTFPLKEYFFACRHPKILARRIAGAVLAFRVIPMIASSNTVIQAAYCCGTLVVTNSGRRLVFRLTGCAVFLGRAGRAE